MVISLIQVENTCSPLKVCLLTSALAPAELGVSEKKTSVWLVSSGRDLRWFPRSSNNRAQVHSFDQSLVKDNFV